ncbi:hypothetical protein C8F04DRAFT_1173346 [Mycena alexandri]|uniref:Uncharacterized protein n=1 Tax=Mycena alexandri TaxID=1745969 RepID=A0AAD6TK19_9AGAR|nr:hypothetical protein C8F04DRAFT_1173346 [Mycena alexandri]
MTVNPTTSDDDPNTTSRAKKIVQRLRLGVSMRQVKQERSEITTGPPSSSARLAAALSTAPLGLRAVAVADGNGSRRDGYRPVRCGRGTCFLTDGDSFPQKSAGYEPEAHWITNSCQL